MRVDRILAALLLAACLLAALVARSGPGPARLSTPDLGGPADLAVVDVYGVIADQKDDMSPFGAGSSATTLVRALRKAEADGVKAVVLRINSPGGTAAASHLLYREVTRLRRDRHLPVVAALGDVAASGGYYVASAASRVVANPSSTTGSIGVIVHTQNLQGLMGKLGITHTTIQSGPHKDILSPYRTVRPDERAMLQALVDDTYQQFLEAVVAGRGMPLAKLRPLADGRIYTGRQAKALGLVDELGTYQDAIALAARLAGLKGEPRTRRYTGDGFLEDLMPRVEGRLMGLFGGSEVRWAKVPLALME